jgi:rhodanese-related sulfurtransferase
MKLKTCGIWCLVFLFICGMTSAAAAASAPFVQDEPLPTVEFVTAEELKAKLGRNDPVTIIDVRSTDSYVTSNNRIKGSLHLKLRRLRSRLAYPPLKNLSPDSEIVAYCACTNDVTSVRAAQILMNAGFRKVKALKGGWNAWLKANGQVESRPKPA